MTEDELRAIEARRPQMMIGQPAIIQLTAAERDALAAALREAWAKHGEYWHRADRAEKAADEYHERMCAALHPPCSVCGNEERHSGTGALTCECPDPAVTRALAAEADCKRLQDEVANLDAARREAEAAARETVARWMVMHSFATGHGDTLTDMLGELSWQVAEIRAAAAEMREALERISALFPKRLSEVADRLHLLIAIEDTARAALSSPTPGAALLAERDRLREALEEIAAEHDAGRHDGLPEPCPALDADTMFALARAALKETSNG